MNVQPAKPIDKEAETEALRRAIAIERKAHHIDFRGRRSTFSEFMRRTSEKLCKRYPEDLRWSTLKGLFRQYPNSDVATRIAILHRATELLAGSAEGLALSAVQYEASSPYKISSTKTVPVDSSKNIAAPNVAAPNVAAPNIAAPKNIPASENTAVSKPLKTPIVAEGTALKPSSDWRLLKNPKEVDVKFVRGVGPKISELLSKLNIFSAEDLLRHYPRQHLDFQNRLQIKNLKPGQDATIFGTIRSVGAFQSKKGNISIVSVLINDGTGSITISRFIGGRSNKFLLDRYKDSYPKGAQVMASGRVEKDNYGGRLQLKNAEVEVLGAIADGDEDLNSLHAGRLVPVYPLIEGLSLRYLRSIIHNALESYAANIVDPLPESVRNQYDLLPLDKALWAIHFPEEFEQKEQARKRLVFDELLIAQLQLVQRRHRYNQNNQALSLTTSESLIMESFRQGLPFKLTGAQERVFQEIASDLASPQPMHRLVQGDVGSGKTVVAAMASLLAIENGYQVAVMAPTEILAEQHYRQFQRWLTPLGLRCGLFLGKQGVKERRQIQQDLLAGQVHVAIGTHALIQDDVEFKKLGFVVIDEQHRFGVKQRAKLKSKGLNPELLTMTATPIPRTLALTLHGDLDVSEIDELPPGRKPVETQLKGPGKKNEVHSLIRTQILLGRQAYIVFPLIEESETLAAKAATIEYEKLRTITFPELRIGLMHGKLKAQEKDEVMEKFRNKEYDILVSTTVIEVGVDVPNASVMVIENADRFGLAQLHQLRGRVGRGADQSYCYLVADAKSELTKQRLGIMTQTNDGFVVAEKDLELRGPGEFLGVRQSGMPDLVLADIVLDAKILEEARNAALEMIKTDPELKTYPRLAEILATKQDSEAIELLSSG